jgi:hypothetical protein
MLETRHEYADVLRAYISDLRRDGIPTAFYERLNAAIPDPNAALADFLQSLMAGKN